MLSVVCFSLLSFLSYAEGSRQFEVEKATFKKNETALQTQNNYLFKHYDGEFKALDFFIRLFPFLVLFFLFFSCRDHWLRDTKMQRIGKKAVRIFWCCLLCFRQGIFFYLEIVVAVVVLLFRFLFRSSGLFSSSSCSSYIKKLNLI